MFRIVPQYYYSVEDLKQIAVDRVWFRNRLNCHLRKSSVPGILKTWVPLEGFVQHVKTKKGVRFRVMYCNIWEFLRKEFPWLYRAFTEPLEELPLLINDRDLFVRGIVAWRLEHGK